MQPGKTDRVAYLVPLGVSLLLIGAFFLGSRFPHIAHGEAAEAGTGSEEMPPILDRPTVKVWVSRDGLFFWNQEGPAALDQLPARIARHKAKHRSGHAEVSSEDLAQFDKVVYVIAELKGGGFSYVTVLTKPKKNPEDPSW